MMHVNKIDDYIWTETYATVVSNAGLKHIEHLCVPHKYTL